MILLISTLDTKGKEALYLKDRIEALGGRVLLMDISMGRDSGIEADVKPSEVALKAGEDLEKLREKDRAYITEAMIRGGKEIAVELYKSGKVKAVIGVGGSTGSLMATEIMRALPFGVPKLMVSSTAALPGLSTRYIGTGDIMLFHSVIEISGLSYLLKNVLDRAARAIVAMCDAELNVERGKAVALTMLGPCEMCARRVREALEERGFQVIGFSAAGIGDRAMEEMIRKGFFGGVIDLATGGVLEHIIGGMRDAGPDRMEAAGEMGIPQVVSVCGLNHITPPKKAYTEDHKKRRRYDLDRHRTWLRASVDELKMAARAFAEKLNKAKGPVTVVIPLKGWSSVDRPGGPTYDPEEDMVFVKELKEGVAPKVRIVEVDANMEDEEVSRVIVDEFLSFYV